MFYNGYGNYHSHGTILIITVFCVCIGWLDFTVKLWIKPRLMLVGLAKKKENAK